MDSPQLCALQEFSSAVSELAGLAMSTFLQVFSLLAGCKGLFSQVPGKLIMSSSPLWHCLLSWHHNLLKNIQNSNFGAAVPSREGRWIKRHFRCSDAQIGTVTEWKQGLSPMAKGFFLPRHSTTPLLCWHHKRDKAFYLFQIQLSASIERLLLCYYIRLSKVTGNG